MPAAASCCFSSVVAALLYLPGNWVRLCLRVLVALCVWAAASCNALGTGSIHCLLLLLLLLLLL
jgi:hypothetical protein